MVVFSGEADLIRNFLRVLGGGYSKEGKHSYLGNLGEGHLENFCAPLPFV